MYIRAFGSTANDGILKTMGPFRIISTADSTCFPPAYIEKIVLEPIICGDVIVYGKLAPEEEIKEPPIVLEN